MEKIDLIRNALLDQAHRQQAALSENARTLVEVEQLPRGVRVLAKKLLAETDIQRRRLDVLESLACERI